MTAATPQIEPGIAFFPCGPRIGTPLPDKAASIALAFGKRSSRFIAVACRIADSILGLTFGLCFRIDSCASPVLPSSAESS